MTSFKNLRFYIFWGLRPFFSTPYFNSSSSTMPSRCGRYVSVDVTFQVGYFSWLLVNVIRIDVPFLRHWRLHSWIYTLIFFFGLHPFVSTPYNTHQVLLSYILLSRCAFFSVWTTSFKNIHYAFLFAAFTSWSVRQYAIQHPPAVLFVHPSGPVMEQTSSWYIFSDISAIFSPTFRT